MAASFTLAQLAKHCSIEYTGAADTCIDKVATLISADADALSFLANPIYHKDLANTRAGIVILSADKLGDYRGAALISDNPQLDYARIANLIYQGSRPQAFIHPQASIDPDTTIGNGVCIAAGVVVEAGVSIGNDCRIDANATLCHGVNLGERVIIHSGAVIGADGFGLAFDQDHWVKIPQLGSVIIGDDCEIGANTTIDRGAIEDTVLENDVRLDNLVQIAHNVKIGAHTAMAGCVGVAGSTTIGKYCMIAGASGIGGHIEIADHVTITAMSMVTQSILEPGHYGSGVEAQPHADWRKNLARLRRLDKTIKKLLLRKRDK
ncbi:MAG: UDP-3-O-(3-hydroxymyristoyl)glucosamine N-acyltransferase [Xanthomonadales bacterium]|nr:UDP-3-O-(3-hydroxymyristoyl)glucosamine N-acyltransferase [Xanthomonadales bacterium]